MGRMEDKFNCMKVTSCLTEKRAERLILWLSQVVFKLKLKYKPSCLTAALLKNWGTSGSGSIDWQAYWSCSYICRHTGSLGSVSFFGFLHLSYCLQLFLSFYQSLFYVIRKLIRFCRTKTNFSLSNGMKTLKKEQTAVILKTKGELPC